MKNLIVCFMVMNSLFIFPAEKESIKTKHGQILETYIKKLDGRPSEKINVNKESSEHVTKKTFFNLVRGYYWDGMLVGLLVPAYITALRDLPCHNEQSLSAVEDQSGKIRLNNQVFNCYCKKGKWFCIFID